MKSLLFALTIFAIPSAAIAEVLPLNLPANHMVWRGKVYNLDHLAGKGVSPRAIAPTSNTAIAPVTPPIQSSAVQANRQRVEFENARSQLLIERLRNLQ